jgi:hypothetical protein
MSVADSHWSMLADPQSLFTVLIEFAIHHMILGLISSFHGLMQNLGLKMLLLDIQIGVPRLPNSTIEMQFAQSALSLGSKKGTGTPDRGPALGWTAWKI